MDSVNKGHNTYRRISYYKRNFRLIKELIFYLCDDAMNYNKIMLGHSIVKHVARYHNAKISLTVK